MNSGATASNQQNSGTDLSDEQISGRPAMTTISVEPSSTLIQTLKSEGQEHIIEMLSPSSSLTAEQRSHLISQLERIDWHDIHHNLYTAPALDNVTPSDQVSLADRATLATEVEAIGRKAYENGEVAALLVAGGDGSRLGFDRPKGCYPIGPVSEESLYQKTAEKVLSASRETGRDIPLILMTGPSTHAPTVEFFNENKFFGLKPEQVIIFEQGTVPTFSREGKLLLRAPGDLLVNPNGHGGSIPGMIDSGTLDALNKLGIKDIVYIQVDNALAPIYDPFTVGLRRSREVDIVNKVVSKVTPQEKMGALVKVDNKDIVVEYSDLTDEQKVMTVPGGGYLFNLGNVAAHVLSVNFINRLRDEGFHLPYHKASKEVAAWKGDLNGGTPVLEKVSGVKYETFFFDILARASCVCAEVSRSEEFAPVKSREGADSPATTRQMMDAEFHRWFSEAGIEVPPDCVIEIAPRFAATLAQFKEAVDDSLRNRARSAKKTLFVG